MTETQSSICTWADATFGVPVSDASIAARALVEMAKLVTAVVNGEPAERIGVEIADVVIVLARLGVALGIDVVGLIDRQVEGRLPDHYVAITAASTSVWLAEILLAVTSGDLDVAQAHALRLFRDLAALASWNGINLPAAIDAKMAVNRTRKWVRDGNGHGRHVEEPTP